MSFSAYPRPPAWRGNDVFTYSAHFQEPLENVLKAIASGRLPSESDDKLRRELHRELELGSGVLFHDSRLLRNLEADPFRDIFRAFCLWLGFPVSINQQGDYLKEVRDHGLRDSNNAPQRGHLTRQELTFHSDRADLTVLGCWSPAAKGGEFRIRSSVDIVAQIEQRQPDWLPYLYKPIAHDLRNEGDRPWFLLPLLSENEHLFVMRYIRKFNDSVIRHGVQQPPDVRQMLTEIDEIIEQPGHFAEIHLRKGMLIAVNNHTTLHARTQFENDEHFERCLLRCWLSSEFTRPLPDSFQPLFHSTTAGALRGGVRPDKRMTT
ncbi:clavaminic acid synthetase [Salmonella enterica]|nr:clavaminic acid synthetase [Salmonella enterica]EDB9445779.1 clavaminic acid synthetase [Salmonella enterica subsp. enterica serovar Enteritidis]EBI5032921.1 clavaminic acid synthetase [Salmonella enterica]EBN2823457.1 clavaminic acid synthetase [Salmonella enterica]ECU1628804.1 clavaminic acid synthetase [Salmonella enterica]